MEVLKIATAGNVDDGKSTLIGRLLFDTNSLTKDKVLEIEVKSKKSGRSFFDFSMATDGLIAEREQGITIDVAHIYFSTKKRSFIIADTPGHFEYTRNMVTGASISQAAIILIDARKGVVEQTYRHFYINNLLRIDHVIVAINKMDLVDFSEDVFSKVQQEFVELMNKRDFVEQTVQFIPISALKGDNVVNRSENMKWYSGDTLLDHLIKVNPIVSTRNKARFPIQHVIRPNLINLNDFIGLAGKVNGGSFLVGDEIVVLPSMRRSRIKSISIFDEWLEKGKNQSSVTLVLEDDLSISRGNLIARYGELPEIQERLKAIICWMDSELLEEGKNYVLLHGVHKVSAKVNQVLHKIEPDYSGINTKINKLEMNDIAMIDLVLDEAIFVDSYMENQTTGSFILIDYLSKNTVAVGFIQ